MPPMDEEAMQNFLAANNLCIPQEANQAMEVPISLHELHQVALQLANNKMPRHNGILVEFFLGIWEDISPILLMMFKKGLVDGFLHPQLTKGLIVLLEKKGVQLLVTNKQGITLLNCGLKILTKLFQIYLTIIFQGYITK